MNIVDEVIAKNTLKTPSNTITQEFVVRVAIRTDSNDPKFIRGVLDDIVANIDTLGYKIPGGFVEVQNVYAK
jgi:hypothetical protein